MSFVDACKNNDIKLAKTHQIPDKQLLNKLFIEICEIGNLEMAKWLHNLGADIYANYNSAFIWTCANGRLNVAKWLHSLGSNISTGYNDAFILVCFNGHLDVAKWLHSLGTNIYAQNNEAFINACKTGYLDVAKWLHSLGANIYAQNNESFRFVCINGHLEVAQWLIDIHYKYGGYIKFDKYTYFSDDIQNLLIDNNLIDPSTLSREDLKYYLVRTDNFVPPDFTTTHEGFNVKYRGKHTKPALRE